MRLPNRDARRLFLHKHALGDAPAGPARGDDLAGLIDQLGFVQVDSVRTVERAHHMILFSRRPAYRPKHLKPLQERDRRLFEHWTHDAAVIPMGFYPHWQMRFRRDAALLKARWRNWRRDGFEQKFADVLRHIEEFGPASSMDVGSDEARSSGGWWDWHPSKTALEYLWRSGALTVTRREGFRKIYDLTERVIPDAIRQDAPEEAASIDWLCWNALDRLGFATPGEIAAFWDTLRPAEAKAWSEAQLTRGALQTVEIECVDGSWRRSLARPGLDALAADAPDPPSRLRVLSPFDPALRDRKRAERLFGFHYRIEIFVPAAQRKYGYYVFPLLEGDRLVGRADICTDRDTGCLRVDALWPEHGVRWGRGRQARFEAELERLRRFTGLDQVRWSDGWLRAPL
ncbi:MAG: crosslink repair DNA glycosylase YcaQ family protein [Paracoccaceae bacterium]|nr:crosslink repair DNA glycosylase YcaQ family protein [Paracoccaceae bacterium]